MNTDWKTELFLTGNIVQDNDDSVEPEEAERRFNRYIEMLDAIEGVEGIDCARTIIQSMRAKDDYGAYSTTQRTLGKFPGHIYTKAMALEIPALIKENKEWAGELLCGLANSVGSEFEPDIQGFMERVYELDEEEKDLVLRYIESEEVKGWLSRRVGVLKRREVEPSVSDNAGKPLV